MATVVLDNGAGLAKVGLSTHKAPRYFIFLYSKYVPINLWNKTVII